VTCTTARTSPAPSTRPQFLRDSWLNLNGLWEFEIDQGDSGLERGLLRLPLDSQILVPFAPESAASGVGNTDFLEAVWYRRTITIPPEWAGQNVHLNFGAVDYDTTVWVDGVEVARHRGGYTPFTADLSGLVSPGETATIVVRARDSRYGVQARGKQATWAIHCHWSYVRTTGIWQTVWLEAVPQVHMRRPRITPLVAECKFSVIVPVSANRAGLVVRARLSDRDGEVNTATVAADWDLSPTLVLSVPEDRARLWSPEDPHLYDLELSLVGSDGVVIDRASTYAGLRSVTIDGTSLLLNGRPVFQRLVLDQGYWPESIMTAPSDAAFVRDIELAMAAGFNGARLHQKVFEERYLYHADRLGYLVWAEFADWGASGQGPVGNNQQPTASFITQWLEVVERDYNHPSIIGWCPLNETYQNLHDRLTVLDDVTRGMFLATKLADGTRPVLDASGYSHRVRESDIYDAHSYEQDPSAFAAQVGGLAAGRPYVNSHGGVPFSVAYRGQPYFISEFGGIWWNPDDPTGAGNDVDHSWGYGNRVQDEEEFHRRFAGLTAVLLGDPLMFGYCYTQLTDVFQEQNGIYRFDRTDKLDVARVRAAQLDSAPTADPLPVLEFAG
jgi:beta-galactosidase/beta-glucuronidase